MPNYDDALFDKLQDLKEELWDDPMQEVGVNPIEAQHRHLLNIIDNLIDVLLKSVEEY